MFKKNGPPTNYKFQKHNSSACSTPGIPSLQDDTIKPYNLNVLYFVTKYVLEWNEGFILAAPKPLMIEITIKLPSEVAPW